MFLLFAFSAATHSAIPASTFDMLAGFASCSTNSASLRPNSIERSVSSCDALTFSKLHTADFCSSDVARVVDDFLAEALADDLPDVDELLALVEAEDELEALAVVEVEAAAAELLVDDEMTSAEFTSKPNLNSSLRRMSIFAAATTKP